MDQQKDFTYNKVNFSGLPQFIRDEQKNNDLRWVIILDPAILANDDDYETFTTALDEDVFIKWPHNLPLAQQSNPPELKAKISKYKNSHFGKVWPNGPVLFPDFFKNKTQNWWIKQISDWHNQIQFDGLWIVMIFLFFNYKMCRGF